MIKTWKHELVKPAGELVERRETDLGKGKTINPAPAFSLFLPEAVQTTDAIAVYVLEPSAETKKNEQSVS
jgi:hypothetical protein